MSGEDVDKARHALSHPGPWDIPEDTIAIGDTQYVEYTGAGPWIGSAGCSGGMTDGAEEVRGFLREAYPQISSIGGYSCRHINGDSSTTSVHATGRALDIMLPLHEGDADNDLGDPIGNWLIEHAEYIGIQLIIWDRWSWGAHRPVGEKERSYGGAHPHHDHLHVELSVEASGGGTDWFAGPRDLPDVQGCELPADGIVDDAGECFAAYGPAEYWRTERAGHGGGLRWTNAFESDSPSNWARWRFKPAAPGDYEVAVYVEPGWGAFAETRYLVVHSGITSEVTVDQRASSGWVSLGVFPFAAEGAEHVSVYDDSPFDPGESRQIVADALRVRPAGGGGGLVGAGVSVPAVEVGFEADFRAGAGLNASCSAAPAPDGAPVGPLGALAVGTVVALLRRRR
jgi:MYXO-CTERM domain-containing protein